MDTISITKTSSEKEASSQTEINSHIQDEMGITVDDASLYQKAKAIKKKKKFKRAISLEALAAREMKPEIKEKCEEEWLSVFVSETPRGFEAKITPDLAHFAIKYHTPKCRLTTSASLKKWERAMQKGTWSLNGQGIVVNTKGNVEDGCHRLVSCFNAQAQEGFEGFNTMVMTGQPVDSHETIDRGKSRTTSDDLEFEIDLSKFLMLEGARNKQPITKEVTTWACYIYNTSRTLLWQKEGSLAGGINNKKPTLEETRLICSEIFQNERWKNSIKYYEKMTRELPTELTCALGSDGGKRFKFIRLKGTAVPLIQYLYLQPVKAKLFINKLINGKSVSSEGLFVDLPKYDPATTLRNYILFNRNTLGKGAGNFASLYHRVYAAISADYKGNELKVLKEKRAWFRDWTIPKLSLETEGEDNESTVSEW